MQQQKRYSSFLLPIMIVLIMWIVKIFEINIGIRLSYFGLSPKSIEGLQGILFMPFLHGGPLDISKEAFDHIMGNTIPILFLGTTIFYFYREVALKVVLWSWFMTGLWLWVGGEAGSTHIGASGLVYAWASFTFFSGIIRKHYKLIAISLTVVFLYGSMIWGIFPIEPNVSWEGHLFGGMAGGFLAWYFRKIGMQKPVYDWENEEDEDDQIEFEEIQDSHNPHTESSSSNNVTIHYIYKPNDDSKTHTKQ